MFPVLHSQGAGVAIKKRTKATRSTTRKTAAKKKTRTARKTAPAVASAKQQFLKTLQKEHQTTLKVLRALPPEQSEFRPHPRSQSARELAFTFVMEQVLITKALTDTLVLGSGFPKPPEDIREIIGQFEKDQAALVDLIRRTPEPRFYTTVKFPTGPGQMGDWTKMDFAFFILCDQIHHRGQYSVYVRMAGGKVPSIYGPSGDEPWF
jgi:uncharacterized damage-inducible protein DinB